MYKPSKELEELGNILCEIDIDKDAKVGICLMMNTKKKAEMMLAFIKKTSDLDEEILLYKAIEISNDSALV